jgi:hypothetical protein
MSAQNSNGSTAGKGELTQEQEWIAQGETPQEQERRATELSLGRIRAMIKDWQEHERPKPSEMSKARTFLSDCGAG